MQDREAYANLGSCPSKGLHSTVIALLVIIRATWRPYLIVLSRQ